MSRKKTTADIVVGGGSIDRFLREIANEQALKPEVEKELAFKSRQGDLQARDSLIKAHLKFVVSVAKQYRNQGLEFQDLINEGNIGLIKAAEKFDETRGIRFISYAVWWIRQTIVQALDEDAGIVKVPMKQVGTHNRIKRVSKQFVQSHERWPSNDELAIMLDMSGERVRESLNSSRYYSVDEQIAQGEKTTLLDVIVNKDAPQADGLMAGKVMKEDLEKSLAGLDERQCAVVRMCYGIGDDQISMAEIGLRLGIKRERVRQIRDKALRKMRKTAKDAVR